MPFFGPSLAGRSNSATGTFTLTRWAAICAPMTPAPSTATLRTWNRLMDCSVEFSWGASLDADPGLRAAQQRSADVAAHLELPAAVGRREPHLVDLAVVGIEDGAAVPQRLLALLDAANDLQADDRLVLAIVAALVADGVLLAGIEHLLHAAAEHAAALADAHQRLLGLGLVVDRLPHADRRGLREGAARRQRAERRGERHQKAFHAFLPPGQSRFRTAPLPFPSAASGRHAWCGSGWPSQAAAWRSRSARWRAWPCRT